MDSMRQRLLLVAGWAVAAVVASLVSAGAVAVAGGQVTDRPLRPLSASEVAALTEECGSSERAPCLRQLDNSADPTTTVTAAPESNLGPNGGEDGVSPPNGVPADTPSEDPLDPGVEVDPSLVPPEDESPTPAPRAEVVDMIGGRVSVSGAEGVVKIIWTIPKAGFALLPAANPEGQEQGSVTVLLSDGSHQSILTASWDAAEGLVIEESEGGVGRADS